MCVSNCNRKADIQLVTLLTDVFMFKILIWVFLPLYHMDSGQYSENQIRMMSTFVCSLIHQTSGGRPCQTCSHISQMFCVVGLNGGWLGAFRREDRMRKTTSRKPWCSSPKRQKFSDSLSPLIIQGCFHTEGPGHRPSHT